MPYVLSTLLVLALLPRAVAQDNEAEKLFRAMEKKITEAKAFKVAVAIETGRDTNRPGSFKGFLLLTKDNKARLKVSGVDFGEVRNWEMISNGKQVKLKPYSIGVPEVAKEEETLATPKNLHGHLATRLSCLGVFPNVERMAASMLAADAPDQKFPIGGFKAGAAEKVGGRDAKVVRYKMALSGIKDDDAAFTVWIDTKTLLPLKRVSVLARRTDPSAITEIYQEFTLDPKLDAGSFELNFPVSDAEKLFRAMEQKIKAANAVQVTFNMEVKSKGREAKGKASLLFTKENQARLTMSRNQAGKEVTIEMISDGKRMKYAESPETIAKAEAERTPRILHDVLSTMASGPSLWLTYDFLNVSVPGYLEISSDRLRLVSFEAGAAEKVGDRDAKVITYIVAGLPGTDYEVTVWIDAQTSLPLKRVIVPIVGEPPKQPRQRKAPVRLKRLMVPSGREPVRLTETCEFTLNPKIDAGTFKLPK